MSRVDAKNRRAIKRLINRIDRRLTQDQGAALRTVVKETKKIVRKAAPKITGQLRRSVKSRVRYSNNRNTWVAKLFLDTKIAPYANVIERGRGTRIKGQFFFKDNVNLKEMSEQLGRILKEKKGET